MKHFSSSIDEFAKEVLENHEMAPSGDTWEEISAQLDAIEYKKQRNSYRVSVGMLLLGLFCSIQFTGDREVIQTITTMEKTVNPAISLGKVYSTSKQFQTVAIIEQSLSRDIDSTIASNKKSEKDEGTFYNKTEQVVAYRTDVSNTIAKRIVQVAETEPLKKTMVPSMVEVTEADINLLLKKARTNIQRGRSLAEIRKSNAHTMLTEVEREIELPMEKRFYSNIKQSFGKLKTIIAN